MVTLNKKTKRINNDVNWREVNKANLLTLIGTVTVFLISICLSVGLV